MNTAWLDTIPAEHRQFYEGLQAQIASWQYDKADALNAQQTPHTITNSGLVDAPSWEHKDETLIGMARNFRTQLQGHSLTSAEPYAYLDQVLTELDTPPG